MHEHFARAVTVAGASAWTYFSGVHLLAQSVPVLDTGVIGAFLEKGGTAAVLLVVLWAYRRDYLRQVADERQRAKEVDDKRGEEAARSAQLIDLLSRQAVASEHVAVSIAQNNEVLRQVSSQLHDASSIAATTAASVVAEAAKAAAASVAEAARVAVLARAAETRHPS